MALTARYTENSVISPPLMCGASQLIEAPSLILLILIDAGAPGNPGTQVLKAATSLHGPRPQALTPHILNL